MSEAIEAIAVTYAPKIMALLTRLRAELIEAGFDVGKPFDMSDDTYRWSMVILDGGEPWVDISFEIAEAMDYDGEPEHGLNFGIMAVGIEGRIIGGLQPFNYTPSVWVDARDTEAVEERFHILEEAEGFIPLLIEYDEAS